MEHRTAIVPSYARYELRRRRVSLSACMCVCLMVMGFASYLTCANMVAN